MGRPWYPGLLLATIGFIAAMATSAQGDTLERVGVGPQGVLANSATGQPAISANGRYVAFSSRATNLFEGDERFSTDVFVRDRRSKTTKLVSVANGAREPSDEVGSDAPSISAGGRFIAFRSYRDDLVAGDTNATADIFVRDVVAGITTRVSVGAGGAEGNGTSDGGWRGPAISADGTAIAFTSWASNLVPGDTNGTEDVFVYDRTSGQTTRVSVTSSGGEVAQQEIDSVAISGDGRLVAFGSSAPGLVAGDTNFAMDVFVHDRLLGDTRMVSDFAGSEFDGPSISRNGRLVAFSSDAPLVRGDTNDAEDIFVRNLETGKIRRVSVDSRGRQARCFVGSVEDVPFCSRRPSISPDGRFVAFASDSPDLVSGDTIPRSVDIFVHDLVSGRTRRASVTARGRQRRFAYADEYSFPAMANRYVAFVASADLLRGKASYYQDVFVRGPLRPIHLGSG